MRGGTEHSLIGKGVVDHVAASDHDGAHTSVLRRKDVNLASHRMSASLRPAAAGANLVCGEGRSTLDAGGCEWSRNEQSFGHVSRTWRRSAPERESDGE